MVVLAATTVLAQTTTIRDVIGAHDLSQGSISPTTGTLSGACLYCHAPHSGIGDKTPLWNQTLSKQTYGIYVSSTYHQQGKQPTLGADSSLCLSCHDGTIAPGTLQAYGKVPMTGTMKATDVFGTTLQGSHPFSLMLPLKDSPDMAASLVAQGKTSDPLHAVRLKNGNIECTSCHNPHVQAMDATNLNFLVRDSSNGQMCLACHDPNRVVTGQSNLLAGWTTSIHAVATNQTANQTRSYVGGYGTVSQNACNSCHTPHNAQGSARLLRKPNEQDCMACHNGGTNVSPALPNIFAEFAKIAHPYMAGSVGPTAVSAAGSSLLNFHDAAEKPLLNQNRHATCADCHNSHATNKVATFPIPPAIRVSQSGVVGISALDGVTVVSPAMNQYENCLRCHGTSSGKVVNPVFGYLPARSISSGDPLNLIPQFALTATSSHPLTHDRSSSLPQPSLRTYMLNLDGATQGRSMGVRLLCTDCHNSDDNREFGGSGPNGPHGSKWFHVLERRYEFSQAPGPGQLITNLFPSPDLTVAGPYAMCAKCHDLSNILSNASFSEHSRHIKDGFSCSACHTAHGMGAQSGTISGERLVNFDANVVAPNGSTPVTYNRATNSCTLSCHNYPHSSAPAATQNRIRVRGK
jgi:predicted CXXCH cytochrome family protein